MWSFVDTPPRRSLLLYYILFKFSHAQREIARTLLKDTAIVIINDINSVDN
jgi:hypothetical protein